MSPGLATCPQSPSCMEIPNEALDVIFRHLDYRALAAAACVCSEWRARANPTWWGVASCYQQASSTLPIARLRKLYANPGPYCSGLAHKHLMACVKRADAKDVADTLRWCNVDKPDADKRTPLHLAVMFGRPTAVAQLLAAGASVGCRDRDGATALHLTGVASSRVQEQVARLLLQHGARLDVLDHSGLDPVQRAIKGGHPRLVEVLLHHGKACRHACAVLHDVALR